MVTPVFLQNKQLVCVCVCVCVYGGGGIFFTLNFHWFIVIISLTLIGIYGYVCVGHMTLNHNVL